MAKKTPQNKLNRDLRKAIHSGDGYDDYMTVYQFLRQKQALVTERMKIMRHRIDDFYADGGEAYQKKDGTFRVILDGVTLSIAMDDSGEVTGYEMDGIKGKQDVVRRILSLFFCLHMMPVYAKILDVTAEQIADMDNDNVLRGMSEIRDLIRGDKYLTASSIMGTDIRTEEDPADPFGVFSEEE